MSNLWKGQINTNNEYQKLETISDIELVADSVYTIQIVGSCMLCESSEKPSSGGFLIDTKHPVQYKKSSDADLWVKNESYMCELNIAG